MSIYLHTEACVSGCWRTVEARASHRRRPFRGKKSTQGKGTIPEEVAIENLFAWMQALPNADFKVVSSYGCSQNRNFRGGIAAGWQS